MTDIALAIVEDGEDLAFDFAMNGPDLATDQGLETAVIVSLFSDRLAAPDDTIPDGSGDRRGWWGDLPLGDPGDAAQPDLIGSRLWLLDRGKATAQTAAQARFYCAEGLQWLVDDGVAQSVTVSTSWLGVDRLAIAIVIARLGPGGTAVNRQFDYVWTPTLAGQG